MDNTDIYLLLPMLITLIGLWYGVKIKKIDELYLEKFLHLLTGFSIVLGLGLGQNFGFNFPLSLPEGMALVVFVFVLLEALKTKFIQQYPYLVFIAIIFILLGTYPWLSKGTSGLALLLLNSFIMFIYIKTMPLFGEGSSKISKWLMLISPIATAPFLLLAHASLSHMIISLAIASPIVMARLFLFKNKSINLSLPFFNMAYILLLTNASLRYVADPESGSFQTIALRGAVVLWALAPLAIFTKKIGFSAKSAIWMLVFLQFLAMSIAMTAYLYEPDSQQNETSWSYDSY